MPNTPLSAACFLLAAVLSSCSGRSSAPPAPVAGTAGDPDADVRDYRMHALAAEVQAMPAGAERDYFAGILHIRSGHVDEGTRLLTAALTQIRQTRPDRAVTALETLATAYMSVDRYRDAARVYDDLEQHFPDRVPAGVSNDAALMRILVDVPVQTMTTNGPVRLSTKRNPLGSVSSSLTVNRVREDWLLDTGANFSMVSRSFAARLGLKPLAGRASVGSGITGLKNDLRAAVVPTLPLGGATVHNVVVLVLDDSNMRVGAGSDTYQIHAVLGFPVLRALGRVTFTQTGEFLAGDAAAATSSTVPVFMRGLTPAIECEVEGQRLLFTFDTGASTTDLSVRYYELFKQRRDSWRTEVVESGGAGGVIKNTMYVQPSLMMKVGGAGIVLKDVTIFSEPRNAGIDKLFGNLGQDFVANLEHFTIDFAHMTFGLGRPAQAKREGR